MKKGEKLPDLEIFDDAEYVKGMDIVTTGEGNIGSITFKTTKKDQADPN